MLARQDKGVLSILRLIAALLAICVAMASAPALGQIDVNEIDPFGDEPTESPDDSAGSAEEPDAQEVFESGVELVGEGKWAEAIELFSKVLVAAPSFAPASLERGKCLAEIGEDQLALKSLGDAVNYGQRYPGVYTQALGERGKILLKMGTYQEAVDDFSMAVQSKPSDPEFLFLRGKALIRSARTQNAAYAQGGAAQFYNQAIESLTRAISLDESYAEAYVERGDAQTSLFEFDKAVEDFEQAVELDKANSTTKAKLGFSLVRQADYEKRSHDPDMNEVVAGYQRAIATFGEYLAIEGDKDPEEFEDVEPEFVMPEQVYISRAMVQTSLANERSTGKRVLLEAAIADVEKALDYDDRLASAIYQKAVAQRLLGDLGAAADTFTDVLRLNPGFAEAQFRRGIVYYYLGEIDSARGDFYDVIQLTEQPDGRARFWVGVTFAKDGDYLEAIRMFTNSIRINPGFKPAYNNRGLVYMKLGDYRRAAKDFDELIRRDRNDSVARQRRERARQMIVK